MDEYTTRRWSWLALYSLFLLDLFLPLLYSPFPPPLFSKYVLWWLMTPFIASQCYSSRGSNIAVVNLWLSVHEAILSSFSIININDTTRYGQMNVETTQMLLLLLLWKGIWHLASFSSSHSSSTAASCDRCFQKLHTKTFSSKRSCERFVFSTCTTDLAKSEKPEAKINQLRQLFQKAAAHKSSDSST